MNLLFRKKNEKWDGKVSFAEDENGEFLLERKKTASVWPPKPSKRVIFQ